MSLKHLNSGFDVLASGALNEMRDIEGNDFEGNHYVNIIWECLCASLYVLFIALWHKRHIDIKVPIAATVAFIIVSFIDQSSLSRWYTIVTTSACVAFLCKLYPSSKKRILSVIVIPSAFLIVVVTLFKNGGFLLGGDFADAIFEILSPSMVDIYFAGPVDVNNAIGAFEEYGWSPVRLVNDILSGIPVINSFADIKNTVPSLYNAFLGRIYDNDRGDQIVPLLGQSFFYFGYLLSPLLSVLSIYVSRVFDRKFNAVVCVKSYFYAFVAVWFAVTPMMLNFSINFTWWCIRLIPFGLMFTFVSALLRKKWKFRPQR